jgi:hypothetical protein
MTPFADATQARTWINRNAGDREVTILLPNRLAMSTHSWYSTMYFRVPEVRS